ncbi:MATE family efflux transporter [Aliarcobacter butzleri]|uniref:hypothetical protein n=1 Tax=Aliarcobacter butzleri TaxID=28197 RepID=UPI00125F19F2|nr:hypothetical protein [Aliarcobacter butzleri]
MLKTILSQDFRHTAINQLWRLFSGPALLILIPIYLTAESQGYWYTFVSLAALAVFADMGFSTILLQFSAHEFAHLKFEFDKTLSGSQKHLVRLASLLRFAIKWSSGMGFIAFPIILVVGFFILNQKQTDINWILPWVIYGLASVFVFVNSMLLSFIEGCNSVGEVQKIRFLISFSTVISTVCFLILGSELYALSISLFIGALTGTVLIFYRYINMLKQLYILSLKLVHNWKKEILPLVGKYAISWISGYFIFYIFTPISFHYYGTVQSGQVGLSIAVCTAIFGIANIWMTIIIPKINMLVSQKDYETLDNIFKKHLILSIITYIFGIITLFIIIIFFKDYVPFDERLVSTFSLIVISIAWLFQIIISGLAIYMRAHKEEPLVIPSFLSGIYISLVTLFIAIYLPFDYFFFGFLSSFIWIVPWVIVIFKKYKGEKIGIK